MNNLNNLNERTNDLNQVKSRSGLLLKKRGAILDLVYTL
jgi:hypothetical protein